MRGAEAAAAARSAKMNSLSVRQSSYILVGTTTSSSGFNLHEYRGEKKVSRDRGESTIHNLPLHCNREQARLYCVSRRGVDSHLVSS